ncbi:MAG: CGGC domain-containing protein, partial [Bacteroidales bacterium]|nr:CGGC domain-containing protein [Bacteroidales bacterium]
MSQTTKIGIIICDRYKSCGGGKCFKSLKNHEGAFSIYPPDEELEI